LSVDHWWKIEIEGTCLLVWKRQHDIDIARASFGSDFCSYLNYILRSWLPQVLWPHV